jgi:alpha-ketoglutarate-dependent taurine dioxygenase
MSHLDLDDVKAWQRWVDDKKAAYERRADNQFKLLFDIDADGHIPSALLAELKQQINDYNFALYRMCGEVDDHLASMKSIGGQIGLKALDKNLCAPEDRVTRLRVTEQGRSNIYIPYSNKAIGWHTDGYYNPMHQRVLALVLHCESPSEQGGVNDLLDHDMAYIHLRTENPQFIKALSQPQVMCIPENVENGVLVRPQTCSAVFMNEAADDQAPQLAMRFSKRKRNIIWAQDNLTQEALACLFEFLESDSPYHIRYRLKSGEGLICNNVLHTRSAFSDSPEHTRIYYRARYYNRINF